MSALLRWRNTFTACRKYAQYKRTGNPRILREAEKLAHKVGEMDTEGKCPAMFLGKSALEREWASGRGPAFFYAWMVHKGRFEARA